MFITEFVTQLEMYLEMCCETCSALYHLDCVDPPLDYVPKEDCPICTAEFCKEVTDAKADLNNHVNR